MNEPEGGSELDAQTLALERELSAAPPDIPKPPLEQLMDVAPALTNRGWLPETDFDALEALRADHLRLLDARAEAGAAVRELERQYEAEDKARQEAMTSAYRGGTDPSEVAAVTPPEERKAALDAERERLAAAQEALQEFLYEAVDDIDAGADGWLAELDSRAEEAAELRERAEALLAEAKALTDGQRKLRFWIVRSTGRHPDRLFSAWETRHFPYAELPDLTDPEDGQTLDLNELRGVNG